MIGVADFLLYHVVADFVTTDELSDGQSIETLNGQNVEVAVDVQAGGVTLNDAVKVLLALKLRGCMNLCPHI